MLRDTIAETAFSHQCHFKPSWQHPTEKKSFYWVLIPQPATVACKQVNQIYWKPLKQVQYIVVKEARKHGNPLALKKTPKENENMPFTRVSSEITGAICKGPPMLSKGGLLKCNKCIRKVTIYTKKQVRCVTLKKGILTFANNSDVGNLLGCPSLRLPTVNPQ